MKYRLKALGWHFCASSVLLLVVLGTLNLGWYAWPGWYLTGVLGVMPVVVGVDLVIGPVMTFIVASPSKPRRVLARDISVIAAVQLTALVYGAITLWHGRPLYYAFSVNQLEVVQASELPEAEIVLGRKANPSLAPHWYSRPRWIWVPLPDDSRTADAIVRSAIMGGTDVTDMPRYYKPWVQGLPELRGQLQKIADSKFFAPAQKKLLAQRMARLGYKVDEASTIAMTGRDTPLLAVFDPSTLEMKALLPAKP